jgi:peptidoglycan/LPS O-acetylase OafA/YrhL
MSLQFSLYFDLIRFFAAILVLISHANFRYLSTEVLPLSNHGHIAVIFFFVLSGYVIAYVADVKENNISLYWSSRLSRIYSVALPAIILTPLLDLAGAAISQLPVIYDNSPNDLWLVRVLASLLFLNETWFNSIMCFSNTPFWSLCYEMSYYLIFSLIIFIKGKARWWTVSISCLIIGPKILLLFPVWLMGVYLHHSNIMASISKLSGWILFLASSITLMLWEYLDITNQISASLKTLVGAEFHTQLAFSKYFLGDWILGVLIFINFAAFHAIAEQFSILLNPLKKIIRYAASFTLTLYLFHQPLILFYAALFSGEKGNDVYFWQTIIATIFTIFVLGHLTEHRREGLRQWLRIKLLTLEQHPYILQITS